MQPATYLKMIAGTLPDHAQGSVDDSLRMLAQEALGTPQVHYLRSREAVDGSYHYLALPSSAMASEPLPVTPLAAAFPGHPAHQGPGAYVLDLGTYRVAVLFDGELLDLVCNEAELVSEFLAEQTLPVYQLHGEVPAWRFESSHTRQSKLADQLAGKLTRGSLVLLSAAGLLYGALLSVEGGLQAKVKANDDAASQMLNKALAEIQLGSPLARQMADYQQRTSIAVRAGGWVDAYQVKEGAEHFRMFVPTWITPDYISQLGAGVVADRDPKDEQLLILTKGTPAGGQQITSAETVAKMGDPGDLPPEPPSATPQPMNH